jgi:hypothetical protein
MLETVKEKWSKWLPYIFMLVAALSRWPGLFPQNFSVFYALMFCAGAFFPRNIKWWLPMGTVVVTDLALNLYYYFAMGISSFSVVQLVIYAVYLGLIWFGGRFNPRGSFLGLLSGGIVGAIAFYFITNTAAWILNPEYTKDLAGWIIALTKGTDGHPTTIQFFLNTLTSGGLFTGLFAGAMKLTEAAEPKEKEKEEPSPEEEPEGDEAPGEGKA